jgi:hypothetical protein
VKTADVEGGLRIASLRGEGKAWYVEHDASGLEAVGGGFLRQRRFAEQARGDLLATGVDFTLSLQELSGKLGPAWPAVYLWRKRAGQDEIDMVTGEHYSWSTHYGQVIPSKANAARIAAAMAAYAWS